MDLIPMPAALQSCLLPPLRGQESRQKQVGIGHRGRSKKNMLHHPKRFIYQSIALVIVLLHAFTCIGAQGALPIFPSGEKNIVLGDPLKRISSSFPNIKSMCGTDQNGVFIEAYLLESPDFIDAKEIWFILDRHKLTQIDYVFSDAQFSQLDEEMSVQSALNRYFGERPKRDAIGSGYEDATSRLLWSDYETGERASIENLKRGGVRVSFSNPRLKRNTADQAPEPVKPTPTRDPPVSRPSLDTPGEIGLALQRNRPPNGTIFVQTSTQGRGELTIQNGTKWDAQVKLVSPTRKYIFISVYVHSGKSATVSNIRPNTYKLIYALGEGWDDARNRMFRISSTAAFDKLLTFERSTDYYSTYRVTLHPVEGGNVNSRQISEDDFLSY